MDEHTLIFPYIVNALSMHRLQRTQVF